MIITRIRLASGSLVALLSLVAASRAHAQISVGENVNMVTGRKMPGGDPYLQRQNEPSVAISSLNANHLLAGANDYRAVDIPFPDAPGKAAGDAWAGVFKSLDGGRTWQSTLLPGFPQDVSAEGAGSPLRTCRSDPPPAGSTTPLPVKCVAAADPVVRAGTDGLFYYAGIAFTRDSLSSKVYVARFLDGNDRENGDVTESQDPIRYRGAVEIAAGGPVSAPFCPKGAATGELVFMDKPWIAVDVPRGYEPRCALNGKQAGAVYAVWAAFHVSRDCVTGDDTDLSSDVMFSQSLDCGATWSAPAKISTKNSVMNQGATVAVAPITGRLYVAWRRAAAAGQTDAIMAARSNGRKKIFSNPRVVAKIIPFDQVQNGSRIRTQTMPSLAISSNGTSSWAHVAWSQRSAAPSAAAGALGDARIVLSSAAIHPPPSGDQDADEDEANEAETRVAWSAPVVADGGPVVDDLGNAYARGHQFMPALTFSQGRLVLVYYDSRLDHTRGLFTPSLAFDPVAGTTQFVLNGSGKYYSEQRRPVGGRDPASAVSARFLDTNGVDGFDFFDDAAPLRNVMDPSYASTEVRRTLDVRVAMAPPGGAPVFAGAPVTSYGMGAMDLKFFPSQSAAQLQQLGANPPNLRMFRKGTTPFLGDYIDVQAQTFVLNGKAWTWNTAWNGAPVFHAVWTTNQNVRPPADGDWTNYTPIRLPGQNASFYDPNASVQTFCDPTAATAGGNAGSRNQDIYTARISSGLVVSSPQNAKPISTAASKPTSFVVAAQNTTSATRRFRFGLAFMPAGVSASFSTTDPSLSAVEVEIPARSSAARSVFASVAAPGTADLVLSSFSVTVTELACGAGCLYGSLTVNPPGTVSSLVAPAGCNDPNATGICDPSNAELWLATMSNGVVVDATALSPTNQAPTNQAPTNQAPTNQALGVKDPTNQAPTNQAPTNQAPTNQAPTNQAQTTDASTVQNPVLLTPTNQAPTNQATAMTPTNQAPTNQAPTNQATAVSDYSVDLTNGGNTSTSFHVAFVKTDPRAVVPSPLQVLVTKFYYTPSASGCQLVEVANGLTEVNVPDVSDALASPSDTADPLVATSAATNVTVVLAPGEKKTITLRGFVPLARMAEFASKVAVATVPHGGTGGTTTYGDPAITGKATTTTLTRGAGGSFTVTVTSPQGGTPSGTVQLLVNGVASGLPRPLAGGTVGPFTVPVSGGDQVVAFYPGDFAYRSSSSAAVTVGIRTVTTITTSPTIWQAGTSLTVSARITSGDPAVIDLAPLAVARPDIEFEIDGITTTRQTVGLIASISVGPLAPGAHTISAHFPGSSLVPDYLPSDSAVLTQVVLASAPTQPRNRIVAGGTQSFAVLANGSVIAWGQNNAGALGTGAAVPIGAVETRPVAVGTLPGVVAIDGRTWHSAAVGSNGIAYRWGWGEAIGVPAQDNPFPGAVITASNFVGVSTGYAHNLGIRADGSVIGWGQEGSGQLGPPLGTGQGRAIAMPVMAAVAAGGAHSLALAPDGTVWAWGDNAWGQLGNGTTTSSFAPVQVTGLTGVVAIEAGMYHSMALRADGTVFTWGYNGNGELGQGLDPAVTGFTMAPAAVAALPAVAAISAGNHHALALLADGTVRAWGSNTYGHGAIGDGTFTDRNAPVPVAGLATVQEVHAGEFHSMARTTDGNLWSWGGNSSPSALGVLGNGTTTDSNVPVRVLVGGLGGAPMPVARAGFLAAAMAGRIWIVGVDGPTFEDYDPVTGIWTTHSLPPSIGFQSAATIGSWIYMAGDAAPSRRVHRLDPTLGPSTAGWVAFEPLPVDGTSVTLAAVGTNLYAFTGGASPTAWVYDTAAGFGGTWVARAPIPAPGRTWIRAAALGGRIYALGSADTATTARLDVYDPASDTWSAASAPLRALAPPTLTALNGRLYVTGTGSSGQHVQEYDPALDRWTVSDFSMPTGRSAAAAAAFGPDIYVFGGRPAGGGAALTTTEVFVPEP